MKSLNYINRLNRIKILMPLFAMLISSMAMSQTTVTLEDQCNCEVLQGTAVSTPGVSTPAGADAGDLYVNTNTGTIYFWDGDTWELTATDNQQLQNFSFDSLTNELSLALENGGVLTVDLSDLQDSTVDTNTTNDRIEIVGSDLVITDSDTNSISLPLATLAAQVDTNTTNFTFEVAGADLVITDTDGTSVSVLLSDLAAVINTDEQTASEVPVFFAGSLLSNNVQDALAELDSNISGSELTTTVVEGAGTDVSTTVVGNNTEYAVDVNVDGTTLEVDPINGLQIMDNAVTTDKILDGTIAAADIADDAIDATKINSDIAGSGLVQNATTGALEVDGTAITGDGDITSTNSTIDVGGDASALLGDVTLDVADNAITNAKMADDAITTTEILDGTIATADIADDAIDATKINGDVAGTGLVQNATTGALEVDGTAITGDGDITSSDLTVGGDANALLGDVTLEIAGGAVGTTELAADAVDNTRLADNAVQAENIAADAITAATINGDVAGTGLVQNATTGALEVDGTAITGDGDITSSDLTVGGDANALLGDVTLEIAGGAVGTTELAADAVDNTRLADNAVQAENIAADAITAATINGDVAGTGLVQNATTGALEVDGTAITGDGDITSSDLTVGGDANALLGDVTLEIAAGAVGTTELAADAVDNTRLADNAVNTENITDGTILAEDIAADAITAATINGDVAGTGLVQNATTGALEVDGTAITGDGDITSSDLTVGGDANALLGDVTLEIAGGAVGTTELAADAVDNTRLADNAVQAENIAADAITAATINGDVAGTGLVQNATTGALEVDGTAITGDGDITSSDLTVGGDANALLGDVTLEIAAGAVGTTELAADAVDNTRLADNAVNTENITDGTILAEDIAADAITAATINGDVAGTGLVQNATTGALEVDGTAITGDGDITSSDLTVGGDANALLGDVTLEIAGGAVGTTELAADAVDNTRLADNAVNTENITDGTILAEDIAADAITAATLNGDVAGTGLVQNATTGALEVDGTAITGDGDITSSDLTVGGDANALLGDVTLEIAGGAVGTTELAADAVDNTRLADNAVQAENIAADAITAATINGDVAGTGLVQNATTGALEVDGTAITGDGDITSSDLTVGGDANALLGDVTLEIAAGAVGTTELAADAVDNTRLADNAVNTENITDGTILAEDIAADAITAATINGDVAGTGLVQNATTGALEVDGTAITGDGDITSSDLTVGGDANALLGDVTLEIAGGAVGTTELAADAVDNTRLADNAVNTENITDGTILAEDIAADAITAATLNGDVAGTGLVQNATTGALEVDGTAITGDGDITSSDLTVGGDANALLGDVTLEIAAGAVGTTELAADAVDNTILADNAVQAENIAADAVTAATINGDVAGTGLVQNATTGALEVDGTAITGDGDITSSDLTVGGDANALLGDVTLEIAAGAVGTTELAADAVDNTRLADNAVNTENITNGTILAEDIAADAVTLSKLADGTADGQVIQWDAATSNWTLVDLGSVTVTENDGVIGNEVTGASNGTLTLEGTGTTLDPLELRVSDNGITSNEIAAGAVGATELTDEAVTLSKLADGTTDGQLLQWDAGSGSWVLVDPSTLGITEVDGSVTNEIQDLGQVLSEDNNADGSVITGLGTPVAASDATTKAYVDGQITANTADGSETIVNAGTDINITGAGTSASPYVVNSTFTEVDGSVTNEIQDLGQVLSEDNNADGSVITGLGTPVAASDATTKAYVDGQITANTADGSETIVNGGGINVVTGAGTSASPYVVTGTEVDGSVTNEIQDLGQVLSEDNNADGSVITGLGTPVAASDATTKAYVDGQITANTADGSETIVNAGTDINITGAGTSASPYVVNSTFTEVDGSITNEIQDLGQVLSEDNNADGSVITGLGTPVAASDAATKAYVDALNTNDADAVIGNEVVGPTDGTLVRSGSGDAGSPYTLDVSANGITTTELAEDAVTLSKLADGTADGQVIQWDAATSNWTLVDLGSVTVTENDGVIGNEVTGASNGTLTLEGTGTTLDPLELRVSDNGITSNEIAAGAVGATELTDEAVTLSKLADGTTDGQLLQWDAGSGSWVLVDPSTLGITEVDGSVTNEIQDLGQVLSEDNNADGSVITGLGTPVAASDATTKAYVDGQITANTADGSETIVNGGGINVVTGAGTSASPYVVTGTEVDGSVTNEIQDLGQVLSEDNNADGSVITGLGTPVAASDATTKAYVDGQITANTADGSETIVNAGTDINITGAGTSASPYVVNSTFTEVDGSITNEIQDLGQVLSEDNNADGSVITGLGTPVAASDAATKAYVDALNTNDADAVIGNEVVGPTDGTLVRSGSGDAGSPYTLDVSANGITTTELAEDAVTLSKLADGTADGQVIQWDAATSNWTLVDLGSVTVTENDGVIGNEVTGASNGTLTLEGTGTTLDPLELRVSDNGITSNEIAAGAVGATELTDEAVTLSKLADGTTDGQLLQWDAGSGSWVLVDPSTLGITEVDGSVTNEIQDLGQVLSEDNNADGSVITGLGTPVAASDATTKAYVDGQITANTADGSETIVNAGTDINITGAGTSASPYVVNSTFTEVDGSVTNEIQDLGQVLSEDNNADGSVITGLGTPVAASDATTKAYVDGQITANTADGSETIVNGGGINVVTGAGTSASPYVVTGTEVDGSVTNEIQDLGQVLSEDNNADGSVITGLGTPVAASDATTKAYVDGQITANAADGSETIVNAGTDINITGAGTSASPYVVNSTFTEVDGSITNEIQDLGQVLSEDNNADGSVITGLGTPVAASDATTKAYVDGQITANAADGSETIVNGGGINSVTGAGTSASPYVVTGTEVDGSISNEIQDLGQVLSEDNNADGSVITGLGTPVAASDATTKAYVDGQITANTADGSETIVNAGTDINITGAGTSASPYVVNSTFTEVDGSVTNEIQDLGQVLSEDNNADGSVLTGLGTPVAASDATTKAYVDGQITANTADGSETIVNAGTDINITGAGTSASPYVVNSTFTEVDGSVTNEIQDLGQVLSEDNNADGSVLTGLGTPVAASDATTKAYVDGQITANTADGSETIVNAGTDINITGAGTSASPYVVNSTFTEVDGSVTNEIQDLGQVLSEDNNADGSVLTGLGTPVAASDATTKAYVDGQITANTADGSETIVNAGTDINITGAGTSASPYVVNSTFTEVDGSVTNEIQDLGQVLSEDNNADGSVITGLGTPVAASDATTKAYVDGQITANTADGSETIVNAGTDINITGAGTSASPYVVNSTFTEVDGSVTNEIQDLGQVLSEDNNADGSVITGLGTPVAASDATTKAYVDGQITANTADGSETIVNGGGINVVTGAGTSASPYVVTGTEVDGSVTNEIQDLGQVLSEDNNADGSVITGLGTPVAASDATTKAYVDGQITANAADGSETIVNAGTDINITGAGTSASPYVVNSTFTEVDGSVTNEIQDLGQVLSEDNNADGSVLTGLGTPVAASDATTKAYVDGQITANTADGSETIVNGGGINVVTGAGTSASPYVVTGTEVDGSVTNEIQDLGQVLSEDNNADGSVLTGLGTPVAASDATTKAYVDGQITANTADGSETIVNAGTDINITGAGTSASPYVVNSTFTEVDGSVTNEIQDLGQVLSEDNNADGSVLTGLGTPVAASDATTKAYVDGQITANTADGSETIVNAGTDINITGAGTSASPYVVNSTFTEVDGSVTNEIQDLGQVLSEDNNADGSVLTGLGTPVAASDATTKAYVDGQITANTADGSETIVNAGTDINITGAGTSASPYVVNSTFTEVDGSVTNEIQDLGQVLSEDNNADGSVLTGLGTPVAASDATTKAYVDGQITANTADGSETIVNAGTDINITGAGTSASPYVVNSTFTEVDGSVTNEIQDLGQVLSEDNNADGSVLTGLGTPVAASDAATKAYVDALNTNDADAVIGNEVVGPTDGTLVRSGSGDAGSPYTLDVAVSGITTNELANNAVTRPKIFSNAITTDKIDNGTIIAEDLANNAVTPLKIDASIAGAGITRSAAGVLSVDGTATQVTAGTDISVTGDGSIATPYVIANTRPNIFYPPSIAIDVSAYSGTTITGESINLYSQYIAQYGSPMVRSDVGGGDEAPAAIPTYGATELYYYVTLFDNTVFDNVSIDANGVMTYDIIGAPADYNSLINVVFVVK